MTVTYRVGVDIGGTFTDIVLLGSDGTIHTKKISSSVDNYARAIVDGLSEVFHETGLAGGTIEEIRHGTTVASNAILEHKGARVGLITTKGFRDVLEIRTLRMPKLYDLTWTKPVPLVERYLRKVVDERIDHRGHVERALQPADAERAVEALLAEKVEAIAICLLNSFTNPVHEAMLRDIVARKAPHLPLSVSFEVLPEIKEYERTSTTVINAYVMPIVATYLRALRQGLDGAGIPARLLLMQSNGGLTTDGAAAERPMNIIESGRPAAWSARRRWPAPSSSRRSSPSIWAAPPPRPRSSRTARSARAQEYAVGAGIMIGSRLLTGAGYTPQGAGDRPRRGRRRRRVASSGSMPAARCRSVPRAPARRPVRSATTKAARRPPSPTPMSCSATSIPAIWSGGALRLNAEKARSAFAEKIAPAARHAGRARGATEPI